jgi:hypothetical protein
MLAAPAKTRARGDRIMRKAMLAAAVAVAFAGQPGHSQQAAPETAVVAAASVEEEPIPLPEGKNQVSPGSFASTTAGIGIVVIGVILLAGIAFLPSQ